MYSHHRFAFVSHLDFNLYRFRLPIMQALRRAGAEVWAITPPGRWAARFAAHGVHFLPWDVDRRTLSPGSGWMAVRTLIRLLRRIQPDVVHSFTQRPNLYTGLAMRWGAPGRWVASVTGLGNLYLQQGWYWALLRYGIEHSLRWTLRAAHAVIFQNRDDQAHYLRRGLCAPAQAHLIRGSGVDVRAFSPERVNPEDRARWRAERGIPSDAFVVVMIARLIRAKGILEFLEAARLLAHPQRRVYFILIGDPDPGNPSSLSADALATFRRMSGLLLPGFQEDVFPWLGLADLYVLPSYREGLPRTVLEAMAMGLPIITTDVPGCRETVEPGKNGFLVPPRDAAALAEKIALMRENPDLRRRMGQHSRSKAVQDFAIEHIVEQHMRLYRQVLSA